MVNEFYPETISYDMKKLPSDKIGKKIRADIKMLCSDEQPPQAIQQFIVFYQHHMSNTYNEWEKKRWMQGLKILRKLLSIAREEFGSEHAKCVDNDSAHVYFNEGEDDYVYL
jgi:hypothetical protein